MVSSQSQLLGGGQALDGSPFSETQDVVGAEHWALGAGRWALGT
jgi:hypothetical protein